MGVIPEGSLRDSPSTEVLQGLSGGGMLGLTDGSAFTDPDNGVPDCNKRINK